MKISYDFDDTLSTIKGQEMAINDIKNGNEVLILTARQERDKEEVYQIADKIGIKHSNIHFTNGKDKWSFVIRLNIDRHYDNNQEQIDKINKLTTAQGILF
jgi:phosphatidylinositol kinase/protein kinase (PI-3  family)